VFYSVTSEAIDDGMLACTRTENENLHTPNPTFTPASVRACPNPEYLTTPA
jgi:hypothetical protein